MKKLFLLGFILLSIDQLNCQIAPVVNNLITETDKFLIQNKLNINKKQLTARASSDQIMLDYPTIDSHLQHKALTGTLVQNTFFWEMYNYNIDTNNLPAAATLFSLNGLIQAFTDINYLNAQNNVVAIDITKSTITIDSINPVFANFSKGGTGNDTIIMDVYEDSLRLGVNPSCNFKLNLSGGKLVGSDTFVVVNAADLDNYMFRKKITLSKGAGFIVKARLLGHQDSKLRCYASYTENCSDSAFARQSRVGFSYYSSVVKPTSGTPYRLALWNSGDLNTPLACKKFYTQNYLIFPFITVNVDSPTVTVTNGQTNSSRCKGEQIQLVANAKGYTSTSLTYSWSPTAGLSASNIANPIATIGTTSTTYTVTVSDGTTSVIGSSLIVSSSPTVSIAASKTNISSCLDSVRLTATVSTGIAVYSWSNGGSNINTNTIKLPGTYLITVTNNFNCTASSNSITVTSTAPIKPVLDFSLSPFVNGSATTVCQNVDINLSLLASANKPGYNYNWKVGASPIGTGNSVTYKFTIAGNQVVTLDADSGDCKATTFIKTINVKSVTESVCKASINDNQLTTIKVYPNPVRNGEVNIDNASSKSVSVRIVDLLGKTIVSNQAPASKLTTIDLSKVSNGVYFVELENQIGKTIQKIKVSKD